MDGAGQSARRAQARGGAPPGGAPPGGEPSDGSRRGTASGVIAVTMWGLSPVATRALVQHLAPLPLLVLRIGIAGLILVPLCIPLLRNLKRSSLPRFVAAGLLGMVGYNLPVTVGLQWLPASTAALILATEPIWILVLSRVFLAERVPRWSWGGAAIAGAGVAVLAGPGAVSGGTGGRALAGAGLVIAATILFAAYTIVLRPLSATYGPVPAAAASTVAGAVPYLLLAGTLVPGQIARLPAAAWGELAFLTLGSTVAGMLLWSLAVVRAGPARAGLLLYLEPLAGVAGAALFLGERLSAGMAAGGVLVMAGVCVAWTAHRRHPPGPRAGS